MNQEQIAAQRLRLLQALDRKDRALAVIEAADREIAETRGILLVLERLEGAAQREGGE
jgi:hypothetical protein